MNYEQELSNKLIPMLETKDVVILGIDGLGGAGKSTISESVAKELESKGINTLLLHIDDLIHPKNIRYNSAYPEWQCYYDLQWRFDYFTDLIKSLKAGIQGDIDIELYDKDNDCYFTQKYQIKGKTAVIVEGIFLQRKEYSRVFDYMAYIDIPEEVRLNRVLKRDTYIGNEQQIIDKYQNRYFPAERRYFSEYHPEKTADLVISE